MDEPFFPYKYSGLYHSFYFNANVAMDNTGGKVLS